MRRRAFRPALESSEIRIAPSTVMVAAATTDDPIPDPQTDPGTYPGTPPPPTSGPTGPATS